MLRLGRALRIVKPEKEYTEEYLYAKGKAQDSLGGYARLVRNYDMRRLKDRSRETQGDNFQFFNHLSWTTRFFTFWRMRGKRFFYILCFAISFNFTGNLMSMLVAMIERSFKKRLTAYKWKHYPEVMGY